jgi:hypothetical protein
MSSMSCDGCRLARTLSTIAGSIRATETYVFPAGLQQLLSFVPSG